MPIHDWTRVDAGLFHDFHQGWTVSLGNALNALLPSRYFALVEQRVAGPIADVLTLELSPGTGEDSDDSGGIAVATAPVRTDLTQRAEAEVYAGLANRVTIRDRHGRVLAIIEIVSPGNKGGQSAFRTFVEKSADLIYQHVNMLVIDLFPPGPRDPQGIHKAIWNELATDEVKLPHPEALTLASYDAGDERVAYVNFVAVGQALPDMPIFLRPGIYIPAPLEASYQTAWQQFPAALRGLLSDSAGKTG